MMKTTLIFFLPIILSACSADKSNEQIENKAESVIPDSLLKNEGTTNNLRASHRNGNVYDVVKVDSLENIISYEPLLVNENNSPFSLIDTLIFKVKNVDSLTYYSYSYWTDSVKFNSLPFEAIYKLKAINVNETPVIKIPKEDLKGANQMYFLWGYLYSRDSMDPEETATHIWNYDAAYFKFD